LQHNEHYQPKSRTTPLPLFDHPYYINIDDELRDEDLQKDEFSEGKALVVEMTKHAWKGYRQFGWDSDEVKPLSKMPLNMFGKNTLLLTLVDSLDTLMVMGLKEELAEAHEKLKELNFDQPLIISLFETNIRVLGGLLSAHALSKDELYKEKAIELGQKFIAAFESRDNVTHIFPHNWLNLMNQSYQTPAERQSVGLAQVGTFSLEFGALSDLKGDEIYRKKAMSIMAKIFEMKCKHEGLYPTAINPKLILQEGSTISLGADGDSFYEYLLKYWLQSGKTDETHLRLYQQAVCGIKKYLIKKSGNYKFLVKLSQERQNSEMEHLTCFAPGMLALGVFHNATDTPEEDLQLARDLVESCYMSYRMQPTGLGPERFSSDENDLFRAVAGQEYWAMRPKVIESLFVLYRVTGDAKYRRWGYQIAVSIDRRCRAKDGGFHGLKNIETGEPKDHQESFFLAETLKYLFLLFSSPKVLPLDQWVFTTEAHPLPIKV